MMKELSMDERVQLLVAPDSERLAYFIEQAKATELVWSLSIEEDFVMGETDDGNFVMVWPDEAFAAQYIACERELRLNREITNINGSGIGLGHPVGATGARIIVTLIHAMKQTNKSLGLATLCGGGGVSLACAIEML